MAPSVIIMGAGLAGLAAGCTLLRHGNGLDVRILERGHVLGGKASSMRHKVGTPPVEYDIDHGLHMFFDYPNFASLLDEVAPRWRERLKPATGGALFFRENQSPIHVRPWRLPSPFHLLAAYRVALQRPLAVPAFGRLLLASLLLRPERLTWRDRRRLDHMSFDDYARSLGISEKTQTAEFMRIAQRATFNFPMPASALSMLRMMRLVQQSHAAQTPSYIDGPSGEVLVDPLVKWFLAHGGRLERYRPVRSIEHDGTKVTELRVRPKPPNPHLAEEKTTTRSNYDSTIAFDATAQPTPERADHYIAAVTAPALIELLGDADPLRTHPYFAAIDALHSTETIACQLYYDRLVSTDAERHLVVATPSPFSSLLDRAQIWTNADNVGAGGKRASVIELVGEAETAKARSDEELVKMAIDLTQKIYPGAEGLEPRRVWMHRSRHDPYFITTTRSEELRPTSCTPLENLYLAGDYTTNSFGAVTMEGAIVSGIEAANQILRRLGRAPRPVRAMTEASGFIPLLRTALHASGTFRLFTGFDEQV